MGFYKWGQEEVCGRGWVDWFMGLWVDWFIGFIFREMGVGEPGLRARRRE